MTKYTNNEGIPLALAVLFVTDNYDHSEESNTISVTTLLDSVRQIILGMRATGEGTKDVSDMVASCYGTALHSALEQAWLDPYDALESLGYPKKIWEQFTINPSDFDVKLFVSSNGKLEAFLSTVPNGQTYDVDLVINTITYKCLIISIS